MPRLAQEELIEYKLPSHTDADPSFVTVNVRPTGDNVFAAKAMLEGPGTFHLLSKHIKKWNYVDDSGRPAPITPETVAKMDLTDLEFITKIVSNRIDEAIKDAAQAVSLDEKKS